jgi:Domain of unknown function (DUF4189)
MTTTKKTQTRRRMASAMLIAAGAVIAGALGSASPAHADEYTYLQIVYSPATGAYGWANGSQSPTDLYNRAMGYCQSYGGTDCRLLGTAVNSCGALAVHVGEPGNFRAAFNRTTRLQADLNALSLNKGGRIILSRCSTGDDGIG